MIPRIFRKILPYAHPLQSLARLVKATAAVFVAFHLCLFLLTSAAALLLIRWNPPVTSLMAYRAATTHIQARPLRFVPLRQVPRQVQLMFISLEDLKFYRHIGVDPGAIRDAYRVNKQIGYALYGGSTITQQLSRTLFLTPRKTYFRKYVEALVALDIDLFLSKERILELYLNYIELGKGVFGIGAASSAFYGRAPSELSVDEFRKLVAILPNPIRFTVETFGKSRQMAQRYSYLVGHFPDPADAQDETPVPSAASPALSEPAAPPAAEPSAPAPTASTTLPDKKPI